MSQRTNKKLGCRKQKSTWVDFPGQHGYVAQKSNQKIDREKRQETRGGRFFFSKTKTAEIVIETAEDNKLATQAYYSCSKRTETVQIMSR